MMNATAALPPMGTYGPSCSRCEYITASTDPAVALYNAGIDLIDHLHHNWTSLSLPVCICEFPWANAADFAPDRKADCSINFRATVAMHALSSIVWLACGLMSFLGFVFARRALWSNTVKERLVMMMLLLASSFGSAWHVLEATARFPGQSAIGLDLTASTMYQLAVSISFVFLFSLPLIRSGTSVVPFAFQLSGRKARRRIVLAASTIMFALSLLSTGLVYAILYHPDLTRELLILHFVSF